MNTKLKEYGNKLDLWQEAARELEAQFDKIDEVLPTPPDTSFKSAAWEMFDVYTDALAELVGDTGEWLSWYAWECEFGRNAEEWEFPDGWKIMVVGPSDLLSAIEYDNKLEKEWIDE